MEKDAERFDDLKRQVDQIVGVGAKKAYLERYIRENKHVPLPLLAQIYEKLGKLHLAEKQKRPWYFKKAAGIWEMDAILKEVKGGKYETHFKRIAFRNALRNYRVAYKIHKKEGAWSDMQDIKNRQRAVARQLRSHGGPTKTFSIVGILAVFVLSFFFLTSWPTGYVISPLSNSETTSTGIVLVVFGILGGMFVLWKWYRR